MPCSKIIEVINPEVRLEFCSLIEGCSDLANTLGKGYEEDIYCRCLSMDLLSRGVRHDYGASRVVKYKGQTVGIDSGVDIVEYECLPFIVMIKVTDGGVDDHDVWRLVRRMGQSGKKYGIVVQFTQRHGVPMRVSVISHCNNTYTLYDGDTGVAKPLRDYSNE
jgi:GxxExxY protein